MPETVTTQDTKASFQISSANLQHLIHHAASVVDDGKFQLEGGKLNHMHVDAAHVALAWGAAPVIDQNGTLEFGLDIKLLKKLLKPIPIATPDDFHVNITQDRIGLSIGRYTYELERLDTSGMVDPKKPELNHNAIFSINTRDLNNALKRGAKLASHVRFVKESPNDVTITCEGDTATMTATVPTEDEITDGDAVSLFSLDYLNIFRTTSAFQGTATMRLGNDVPLQLETHPGECVTRWLLSPRIEP